MVQPVPVATVKKSTLIFGRFSDVKKATSLRPWFWSIKRQSKKQRRFDVDFARFSDGQKSDVVSTLIFGSDQNATKMRHHFNVACLLGARLTHIHSL